MHLILFLASFLFTILNTGPHNLQEDTGSHYTFDVEIDTDKQLLSVSGKMLYPIPEFQEDSIRFLLHKNMRITQFGRSKKFTIQALEGSFFNFVAIHPEGLQSAGDKFVIPFRYSGTLNKEDLPYKIDRIGPEYLELSANSMWLPILATLNNYFTADFNVEINGMPESVRLISSGNVTENGENSFRVQNEIPQIDVVLVASANLQVSDYDHITLYNTTRDQPVDTLIVQSKNALEWLNDRFGEVHELKEGKLVITPREESGYARKNLIILSDISSKPPESIARFVAHEFAHFWTSKVNAQSSHRWIDESMAEYLALKFIDKQFGPEIVNDMLIAFNEEAVKLPPVYTGTSSRVPSHAVMYRKGVAKLFWLENRIGEARMQELLKRWFASPGRTTEDFLLILGNLSGEENAVAFGAELAK